MRMQPLTAAVALTVLTALSFHAGAQSAPERGITRVAGDLYRAQNNQHECQEYGGYSPDEPGAHADFRQRWRRSARAETAIATQNMDWLDC